MAYVLRISSVMTVSKQSLVRMDISPVVSNITAVAFVTGTSACLSFAYTSLRDTRLIRRADSKNLPSRRSMIGSFSIPRLNQGKRRRPDDSASCATSNADIAVIAWANAGSVWADAAVAKSDPVARVTTKSKAVILDSVRAPISRTNTMTQIKAAPLNTIPLSRASDSGLISNMTSYGLHFREVTDGKHVAARGMR